MMTNRPKFLRHYARGVELRVEQIGPNEWGGALCDRRLGTIVVGEAQLDVPPRWDPFTELGAAGAKRSAMATAERHGPPDDDFDGDWRDLSDMLDEHWAKRMKELRFTGYPPREGMERWDGF